MLGAAPLGSVPLGAVTLSRFYAASAGLSAQGDADAAEVAGLLAARAFTLQGDLDDAELTSAISTATLAESDNLAAADVVTQFEVYGFSVSVDLFATNAANVAEAVALAVTFGEGGDWSPGGGAGADLFMVFGISGDGAITAPVSAALDAIEADISGSTTFIGVAAAALPASGDVSVSELSAQVAPGTIGSLQNETGDAWFAGASAASIDSTPSAEGIGYLIVTNAVDFETATADIDAVEIMTGRPVSALDAVGNQGAAEQLAAVAPAALGEVAAVAAQESTSATASAQTLGAVLSTDGDGYLDITDAVTVGAVGDIDPADISTLRGSGNLAQQLDQTSAEQLSAVAPVALIEVDDIANGELVAAIAPAALAVTAQVDANERSDVAASAIISTIDSVDAAAANVLLAAAELADEAGQTSGSVLSVPAQATVAGELDLIGGAISAVSAAVSDIGTIDAIVPATLLSASAQASTIQPIADVAATTQLSAVAAAAVEGSVGLAGQMLAAMRAIAAIVVRPAVSGFGLLTTAVAGLFGGSASISAQSLTVGEMVEDAPGRISRLRRRIRRASANTRRG